VDTTRFRNNLHLFCTKPTRWFCFIMSRHSDT